MVVDTFFDKFKIKALSVIIIGIPALKLLSYFLFLTHIIDDSFMLEHVCLLWLMIPVLAIIYICGLRLKKDNFNYLDIIIISLIVLGFISTFFAKNINVSIFGESRRSEGLLTLISYYLIFLNAKSINKIEDKNYLLKIFLYLGLFQVFYAIIQSYTKFGIVKRFPNSYMAMGLCANPNFFATYMSMLVILSSSLYIKNNNLKYFWLALIYNIGLVLAESSGPFLATIITFIFMVIYFHKKEYIKRIFLISLSLLIVFTITNSSSLYVQEHIFQKKVSTHANIQRELKDTTQKILNWDNLSEDDIKRLGTNRIKIWLNLLPEIKNYWLFGAGIDNIAYIYPQEGKVIVDKAHNVYLQILLTNGLLALILYCTLCMIIFIKGFKLKNNDIAFYMLFVVYCIQAFANISVIDVAPYFFLFFGLVASNFNNKLLKNGINNKLLK